MAKKDEAQKDDKVLDTEEETEEVEAEVEDEAGEEEVETPNPYELLGKVIDAEITSDDEAAAAAFHDFVVGKTQKLLNPDTGDIVEVPADEESEEMDDSTEEVRDEEGEVKED